MNIEDLKEDAKPEPSPDFNRISLFAGRPPIFWFTLLERATRFGWRYCEHCKTWSGMGGKP